MILVELLTLTRFALPELLLPMKFDGCFPNFYATPKVQHCPNIKLLDDFLIGGNVLTK